MENKVLVGESGGSKTDWVLLKDGKIVWQFSSKSLHPKNWNTELFNDLLYDFIDKQVDFASSNLHFFGAGCSRTEKADELKNYFKLFGFHEIKVSGDLLAAGLATTAKKDAYVAILGSGSVLIDFQKGSVGKYFGGLGREIGDEGAGYYFGKLVLEDFIKAELEPIQMSILKSVLTIKELAELNRNSVEDKLCLELSKRLANNLVEFQNYHFQNIDLFFTKYVQPNMSIEKTIHFVGSYAFYHQEIIKSYFRAKGYEVGIFVARPIEKLIELY